MSWFDWVRRFLVIGGAVAAIVFPLYYHFTAKWYRDKMGRFLMAGGVGWASLYLAGVFAIIFPNEVFREIVRTFLTLFAFFFAWYQLLLYRRVRKEELERRHKERRESA